MSNNISQIGPAQASRTLDVPAGQGHITRATPSKEQFSSTLHACREDESSSFLGKVWTVASWPFVKVAEFIAWVFCCKCCGSTTSNSGGGETTPINILEILGTIESDSYEDAKAAFNEQPVEHFSALIKEFLTNPSEMRDLVFYMSGTENAAGELNNKTGIQSFFEEVFQGIEGDHPLAGADEKLLSALPTFIEMKEGAEGDHKGLREFFGKHLTTDSIGYAAELMAQQFSGEFHPRLHTLFSEFLPAVIEAAKENEDLRADLLQLFDAEGVNLGILRRLQDAMDQTTAGYSEVQELLASGERKMDLLNSDITSRTAHLTAQGEATLIAKLQGMTPARMATSHFFATLDNEQIEELVEALDGAPFASLFAAALDSSEGDEAARIEGTGLALNLLFEFVEFRFLSNDKGDE